MNNALGLILSFFLVFIIIGASELLVRLFRLPKEESRKFVHIGVSHWWLLAMVFISDWKLAIIPPIAFILLNLISWYTGMFDAMERRTKDINNLGTVYFPISLLILTLFTWYNNPFFPQATPYIGALGIMTMGYGDGFAALVGTKWGKNKYKVLGATKSFEGSLAMMAASWVTMLTILLIYKPYAPTTSVLLTLGLALLATGIEAITPRGLDNLTVPLTISALWLVLFV